MEPYEEPYEVARVVFDRVMNYCTRAHDNTLECMLNHSPDQLSVFIDAYLNEEENNDLEKAIESSDTFWDGVEKEYEALWKEWWSEKLAYSLGHLILAEEAESIAKDDNLDDASKASRLKAYAQVFKEFADAIKRALQNQKPLSSANLHKWFERLAEFAPSNRSEYIKEAEYYLDYYSISDNVDQLNTLNALLSYINNILIKIEYVYLPKLGALMNKR